MRASEFVRSYFDAWNHHDPVAIADHLANNGVYCDIQENTRRSHDELILTLQSFFITNNYRYELIGDILKGDNTIAFEYRTLPIVQGRKSDTAMHATRGSEFIQLNDHGALTIYDYYQPDDRAAMPSSPRASKASRSNTIKYAKSGLNKEQLDTYRARLEHFMETEYAFLESGLTLPKLAKQINCSVNHLSQAINSGFGLSFFDYLNRYRIEYAKGLLNNPDKLNNSILDIAFTVGYNSNSAFYSAFKKFVGQTPAEYRRRHTLRS